MHRFRARKFILLVIFAVEAVFADPPDGKDDGADDEAVLDELDDDNPDDDTTHVAHISVRTRACALP
eukprot:CAMPEP_0185579150 /NCGR_PEP_ID=MMETSP0434-20130131/13745_1 /TAXON_ID=626734 ORGANISM="Favella taraikaensis, Strain Fe Narragansett Bay" /NCGR_SAMPLE_ID=MMETSP0434 /ASSEMBLY_ACC=CAM_ASM_000379 /LENGTH=66 /DNA_ID=CAMNT_0028197115 /DNA_START=119 /DNA_END=319 /DNA_ORIENTATION=-